MIFCCGFSSGTRRVHDMDKNKTICFSGYRGNKYNYFDDNFGVVYNNLFYIIGKEIKNGYDTFLFGAAPGFDLMAARAVQIIKFSNPHIRLICALPFGNFSQSSYFDDTWIGYYETVINDCSEFIVTTERNDYFKGCFQQRNKFMVNNSSLLVCLFDGKAGGTKQTVEMAEIQGVRIINILET